MTDVERIVVSDIIRAVTKFSKRIDLQNTQHLDTAIAGEIIIQIALSDAPTVIVDGIRQISIVNKILEHFSDIEMVWLEVPTEERKRRYSARKDRKDDQPFEIVDNKPIELECQKIYEILKDRLKVINNY